MEVLNLGLKQLGMIKMHTSICSRRHIFLILSRSEDYASVHLISNPFKLLILPKLSAVSVGRRDSEELLQASKFSPLTTEKW